MKSNRVTLGKAVIPFAYFWMALASSDSNAQSGKAVREFLKDKDVAQFWFYDDLETGIAKARATGKPLLVTIRCVPCQACRGMDQSVVNPTDPQLRDLMSQFVCVRIVQAWGLDLSLFQYDMNMSWAAFLLNADRTIYGRYGTRAAQRNEKAITVPGFVKALQGALELHKQYLADPGSVKALLASKTGPKPRWTKPEDNPVIQNTVRWNQKLGRLTGPKTASCVHCHFVPAAEMMGMLSEGAKITDAMLWDYPFPETIGITLDPNAKATITHVEKGSDADNAGLKRGDVILTIRKQPILSIADIQWILHQAKDQDVLPVVIDRDGTEHSLTVSLPAGWRRRGEFVDHSSSWDLFKVKLFGVAQMKPLTDKERNSLELGQTQMALRVKKLSPSWGGINHDVREAGLQPGDVIVQVDDETDLKNHSELLAYLVQKKKSGETLDLIVLRGSQRKRIQVPLNWSNRIKALRSP